MFQLEENIDFNLLLKFVYGELDPQDSDAIIRDIETNFNLAEIVDGIQKIKIKQNFSTSKEHQAWINLLAEDFRNTFSDSSTKSFFIQESEPMKVINLLQIHKYKIAIAAAVVFILSFIFITFISNKNTMDLYTTHYEKPTFSVQLNTETLDQVQSAYLANDYEKSLKGFKNLIKQNPNNYELQFFMAICFLNQGTIDSAIYYFDQIQTEKESRFSRQASWYKALSFLKVNEKEKALAQLQSLSLDPDLRPTLKKQVQTLKKALK